ncbi:four helix bundle protein [Hydrogenimonas sp.]
MKCETLEVWKRACALSSEIYVSMKSCNDFGFKDQITRSGLSIPSNIAEGIERKSARDQKRFLDIAQASAAELKTQVYIGMKIAYVEKKWGKRIVMEIEEIRRMIKALSETIHE